MEKEKGIAGLSIAAVERETGISKDTLRVWERRYGFPRPERNAFGERTYPAEQVARLRLIHRLMDQGMRPGRIFALSPAEMQGGCFTISSLGGIGGTYFTPIVNAPEVAILGVSRSKMQPVYIDGEFQPRLMLPMGLSYDHRVIDGAQAARFTSFLAQVISDIRRILL